MQSNPTEFLKEATIMHNIEHEHIVRLYGVVLDTNALMLVRGRRRAPAVDGRGVPHERLLLNRHRRLTVILLLVICCSLGSFSLVIARF